MDEFELERKPKFAVTKSEHTIDSIAIDGKVISVTKQESAQNFLVQAQYLRVLQIDPVLLESVPVLFLDTRFEHSKAGYSPEHNAILVPTNSKHNLQEEKRIIEHEIVHALTIKFIREHKIPDFEKLYQAVIDELTEDDVTLNGLTSFNFRKNIYEFVADIITLPNMIEALKSKGIYEMAIKYIQEFIDQSRDELLEKMKESLN